MICKVQRISTVLKLAKLNPKNPNIERVLWMNDFAGFTSSIARIFYFEVSIHEKKTWFCRWNADQDVWQAPSPKNDAHKNWCVWKTNPHQPLNTFPYLQLETVFFFYSASQSHCCRGCINSTCDFNQIWYKFPSSIRMNFVYDMDVAVLFD